MDVTNRTRVRELIEPTGATGAALEAIVEAVEEIVDEESAAAFQRGTLTPWIGSDLW